jgi:hypothetical protein
MGFRRGEWLEVHRLPAGRFRRNVCVHTEYSDEGYDAPVPRDLIVEVAGRDDDLDESLARFQAAMTPVGGVLALATNTAVGECRPFLGYDARPTGLSVRSLSTCWRGLAANHAPGGPSPRVQRSACSRQSSRTQTERDS